MATSHPFSFRHYRDDDCEDSAVDAHAVFSSDRSSYSDDVSVHIHRNFLQFHSAHLSFNDSFYDSLNGIILGDILRISWG